MVENKQAGDDYISPGTIKKAVLNFFRFFFRIFDFFILSVRQNALLFFSFCVLGLLAGFLYTIVRPPSYKTEMIVQQGSLTRKGNNEIIQNLNELISTESYSELASDLKIPEEDAKKIFSINCTDMMDETLEKDTSMRTSLPFKIKVKVSSNTVLPLLQRSLIDYLNNSEFSKQKREGQRKIFMEKLQFVNNELQKIDSLENVYNISLANMKTPATLYNNSFNPSELYIHSMNLFNQKEGIYTWMNMEGNGVLLIDGFKMHSSPQNAPRWLILLAGFVAGAVIGFVLSFFAQLKRELQ